MLPDEQDLVCGCVVSVRKAQDRMALWMKDGGKEPVVAVGREIKDVLGADSNQLYRFELHGSSGKRGSDARYDTDS